MDIDAHAGLPERGRDDRVTLGVHVQPSVLVDRDDRRVAGYVLKILLDVIGQRVVLRVGGHMQGMVAADDEIEILFLAGQNRRAGECYEDLIDVFGRRAGRGLFGALLPEKQVEPVPGRKQALVDIAFKVKAGRVPLGVVFQRQHRLDLIRADPQIVAAVPGVELARLGVCGEVRKVIARLVQQGVFRKRAICAVGVILREKVNGGNGIHVHARVVQKIPDVKPARVDQIRPPAAVGIGIEFLVRIERAAVPVVKLLPGKFRLFDVFVLRPAEVADADRNGIRHRIGQRRKRQRRAQREQQRAFCQKPFHDASFSVEFASMARASSALRS